jgi:hypothetical protein
MAESGIGDFLKEAFKVPYNLILFFGGMLAGVVSLLPQVVWPLVIAAEIVYLATLSTNPRFQALVRVKRSSRPVRDVQEALQKLVARLDADRQQRFDRVHARCLDLQRALQGEEQDPAAGILQGQQVQGVSKLLWVFLRTLLQEQILADFCATMPRKEIEQTLQKTEAALARAGLSEEMKAAHQENLGVLRQRIENLRRAQENLEAISVRLVRVENSIMLIQEQALTRRDPTFIESEVKSVTEGLQSVEAMLRSMDLPQAYAAIDEAVPDFTRLPAPARSQKQ